MTYIVTHRTKTSILMASDTRLNYFSDKVIGGEKYMEITAIADCIRKTFYIEAATVGIQFLGIGYFEDQGQRYPLCHFLPQVEELDYMGTFEGDCRTVFTFLQGLSCVGGTQQYVKGVMAGFDGSNARVCLFNTFNNDFRVKLLDVGQFVDSEGCHSPLPESEEAAVEAIKRRIQGTSKSRWWEIGDEVEVLSIARKGARYILQGSNLFEGTQSELLDRLTSAPESINGHAVRPSHLSKYNLQ